MGLSWTATLMDQDQSLEGALARRKLADNDTFRAIQQMEEMRAQKIREAHAAKQLEEQTRLREAQQAETARRNAETADDREVAQFMTALGLLEPGSMADGKMVEVANRRGLGDLFESGEGGQYKFKGTAAHLRAIEKEKQAEARAAALEKERELDRAREMREYNLRVRALENQIQRTGIQRARESRIAQAQQNVQKLTPQQQIAFRTLLKAKTDKANEAAGGLFGTGLFADEPDQLDLIEQAYAEVTGSAILSPPATRPAAAPGGGNSGGGNKPTQPAQPAPAAAPQPRVIAPGISVTRRQ